MKSTSYQNYFAKLYDEFVGERSETIKLITKLISKHGQKTKSILELATGTGELLSLLPKKFKLFGVDQSPAMLTIAKNKVPRGTFLQGDMRTIRLPEKADTVLLLFDSINHLTTLADWEKTFKTAQANLNKGGLFIFDFNAKVKLDFLAKRPASFRLLQKQKVLAELKIQKKRSIYNWIIRLYLKKGQDYFYANQENIHESTFSLPQVKNKLIKHFKILECFDENHKLPNKDSKRIYIAAKVI